MNTKQRRRHQRGRKRIFYGYADGPALAVPMLIGGAGSFPNSPSRRMATNDDGTIGLDATVGFPTSDGGSVTEATSAQMRTMNQEGVAGVAGPGVNVSGTDWVGYIFPELRELDGWHASLDDGGGWENGIANSGDTTNGIDGTWVETGSGIGPIILPTFAGGRNQIESIARSNIRAIRVKPTAGSGGGGACDKLHIYGEISSGETPDRLLWFDNDDDLEFSLPLDYGDVPRGSAEDHVVYLRNNSGSLTANTVQITAEDLIGGSGGWFTFDDGTGFEATQALAGTIGPGADSVDITIRRITVDAAPLGLHTARALVSVGSWT